MKMHYYLLFSGENSCKYGKLRTKRKAFRARNRLFSDFIKIIAN